MHSLFEIATNNALTSSLVATMIIGLIGWVWKGRRDRIDTKKILEFLVASESETSFTFRSTEAIASHTGISEHRVATLCARHAKIRRNSGEKQSWTLVD